MPPDPPAPAGDDVLADLSLVTSRGVARLLGIEVVALTAERVELRLEVDERLHQPFGILHGGVSALLAETAASFGAAMAAPPGQRVVGIELNASHLRPMRSGVLSAVATPVRVGRAVQVWEVSLTDDAGREICRSRCTLAASPAPGADRTETTPAPDGARG